MELDYQDILFIVGNNSKTCFAIMLDKPMVELKYSSLHVYSQLKDLGFIQINSFTIINTKYLVNKGGKRHVILKGGSVHKVSRNKWQNFKDTPI